MRVAKSVATRSEPVDDTSVDKNVASTLNMFVPWSVENFIAVVNTGARNPVTRETANLVPMSHLTNFIASAEMSQFSRQFIAERNHRTAIYHAEEVTDVIMKFITTVTVRNHVLLALS